MSLLLYQVKEHIAYLTLNRPEKRNALNHEMVTALTEAFRKALTDAQVKVVILKANGKVFCAGADLAYLQQLQTNSYEENLADSSRLAELFHLIYTSEKVVIAQIHGHAIAGGCGLATVCDFSFSVPEASFGYTEVKIGFIPAIVSLFLIRKTGEARARELLLSGGLISAEQAKDYNLINYITDAQVLEERVEAFARELCQKNSAQSMGLTKKLIAEVQSLSLPDALSYAAQLNARARESEDCKKGIAAFINKEEVKWI